MVRLLREWLKYKANQKGRTGRDCPCQSGEELDNYFFKYDGLAKANLLRNVLN